MSAKLFKSHSFMHWVALFLLTAVILSSGCLDDDDDNDNSPPVAKATATPGTVEVNFEIQFSGKGSSDPDGDSLTYHWDFDATDGPNDVDSIAKEPSHSYSEAGSYVVTLTVDDSKLTDKTEITVHVVKPSGQLTAQITTEDETKGTVHETDNDASKVREETINVEFSGEESEDTHPDSDIEKYEWDFMYSGSFETDETGETGDYSYPSGRYVTMLQVTNTTGDTARASRTITVNYNQTYKNQSTEAGENKTFRFPVSTVGAIRMDIRISYEVTNVGGLDEDDMELYLYDVERNEIANTEAQENGSESILIGAGHIYQNGPDASLGNWQVVVENQNSFVTVDDYKVSIDVMYYIPS